MIASSMACETRQISLNIIFLGTINAIVYVKRKAENSADVFVCYKPVHGIYRTQGYIQGLKDI